MRISDWSSDVCSSDLGLIVRPRTPGAVVKVDTSSASLSADGGFDVIAVLGERELVLGSVSLSLGLSAEATGLSISDDSLFGLPLAGSVTLVPNGLESVTVEAAVEVSPRSEEHTSELQSLMRTPYAVFCLKQKTNSTKDN